MKNTDTVASAYKRIQKLGGWETVRLLCEAVLTYKQRKSDLIPKKGRKPLSNPFLEILTVDFYYPSVCGSHSDLARIFLDQCKLIQLRKRRRVRMTIETPPDYMPLRKLIAMRTKWPVMMELPDWLFIRPDIEQITWYFFLCNQDCLDDGIGSVCRMIFHGMPIFRKSEDTTYKLVPFHDHDYIYLSKKAEHQETGCAAREAPGRFPDWADDYYIFTGHLSAYHAMFGHNGLAATTSAVASLRSEFHRMIGIESDVQSANLPVSNNYPLVPLLQNVLNRNCPGLFSDADDNWPKQEIIVRWLRENKGLSDRQAKAIALIATQSR